MNFDLMSIVPAMVLMSWMNQNGYTQRLEQSIESARVWVWNHWLFHPDVQTLKATISQNANMASRRVMELGEMGWDRFNNMTDFEFKFTMWFVVAVLYAGLFAYFLTQDAAAYTVDNAKEAAQETDAKERRMWAHVEFMEPAKPRRPVTRSQMRQRI